MGWPGAWGAVLFPPFASSCRRDHTRRRGRSRPWGGKTCAGVYRPSRRLSFPCLSISLLSFSTGRSSPTSAPRGRPVCQSALPAPHILHGVAHMIGAPDGRGVAHMIGAPDGRGGGALIMCPAGEGRGAGRHAQAGRDGGQQVRAWLKSFPLNALLSCLGKPPRHGRERYRRAQHDTSAGRAPGKTGNMTGNQGGNMAPSGFGTVLPRRSHRARAPSFPSSPSRPVATT